MPTPLSIAAGFTGLVSVAGSLQALIGATLLSRFRRGETAADDALRSIARTWPAITVLKPLHGDELLLDDALDSICLQEYPAFQIVFGVQSTQDTAIPVVERLKARHPNVDITLVVDDAEHGPNRKIGNLINMYGAAHHDIIVVSDSDIHVTPNYLKHVVSALEEPGTDLITTLYAGRPATGSLVQQLGACQINHNFLPGVMMSRLLGRQDCLGATMALTRQKLEAIGGLRALVDHVADDAELGRLIRQQGGHRDCSHPDPHHRWRTISDGVARARTALGANRQECRALGLRPFFNPAATFLGNSLCAFPPEYPA